ncbi:hypothetical protein [Algoriphagus sp.]|uniref:hypothetical protein n=1 Tax=Algoriphagus sp. TaxID=1872435 RepID=UPI003F7139B6
MRKTLIFLILLGSLGCQEGADEIDQGMHISSAMNFVIVDQQNQDLLDPENPQRIDTENIRLFYLIDGQKEEVFDADMAAPRNYKVMAPVPEANVNEYSLKVFMNNLETEAKPTTYIQWADGTEDVLEAAYDYYPNGSVLVQKVWLNGDLIWNMGEDGDFTLYRWEKEL